MGKHFTLDELLDRCIDFSEATADEDTDDESQSESDSESIKSDDSNLSNVSKRQNGTIGPSNIRVPQNLNDIKTDTETESESEMETGQTFESVIWNFDQIATEKKVGDAHL